MLPTVNMLPVCSAEEGARKVRYKIPDKDLGAYHSYSIHILLYSYLILEYCNEIIKLGQILLRQKFQKKNPF